MNNQDLDYIENEAANLSGLNVNHVSAGIVKNTFIGIKYDDKFIGHAWYNKDDSTILNVYVATHRLNSCAPLKCKKSTEKAQVNK